MHTGQPLYTCPNCSLTFASSANMYKHLQRSHKAEYEAHKQQKIPPNIIEQAKSGAGAAAASFTNEKQRVEAGGGIGGFARPVESSSAVESTAVSIQQIPSSNSQTDNLQSEVVAIQIGW